MSIYNPNREESRNVYLGKKCTIPMSRVPKYHRILSSYTNAYNKLKKGKIAGILQQDLGKLFNLIPCRIRAIYHTDLGTVIIVKR